MRDLTKNTFSRKKKNKRKAYGNQILIRLKEKLHVQCGVLKVKVQRSARNDKRRYLHSLVREAEAAIQRKKQGITKHLCKAFVEVIGLQNHLSQVHNVQLKGTRKSAG